MNALSALYLLPVFAPVLCGVFIGVRRGKAVGYKIPAALGVGAASLSILALAVLRPAPLRLVSLGSGLSIELGLDGLSLVFAGILALLWPFATVYAFGYMEHDPEKPVFFRFYTVACGVAMGVALACNFVTMYLFYELLTFITLPLVTHGSRDGDAQRLARQYLAYSVAGAALAFTGFIPLHVHAGTTVFTPGGVAGGLSGDSGMLTAAFLVMALGFFVKCAVFPLHGWLIAASVAPVPVTALLHAVAVVNAGVFAVLRAVYYLFGPGLLNGTGVQDILLALASFTVLYGSLKALRESHLKRRLAYSTVSNLSYIIYGAALMTPEGPVAALTQMVSHSLVKITLFWCVGAVTLRTGADDVSKIYGLGRKMPVTFGCFALASLALVGIPPLPGFLSKYHLYTAGIENHTVMGYMGIAALLASSVLTAMYLATIIIHAFFPGTHAVEARISDAREAGPLKLVPITVMCVIFTAFGLFHGGIIDFFSEISTSLF